MVGDPAAHERAGGQDGEVPLPGRVEAGLDEVPADAVTAELVVGPGVLEVDDAVAQLVGHVAGHLAIRRDLVPLLLGIVGDLQLHDASLALHHLRPRIITWEGGWRLRPGGRSPGPRGLVAATPARIP